MNLRWSIAGVTFLGIVAAFCAAALVASLRVTPAQPVEEVRQQEVKVVVAARALEAMSVVDKDDVALMTVDQDGAPAEAFTSSLQVIGKVLSVPMVAGQALTKSSLAGQDPGVRMAAELPSGMRAVSVELGEYSGLRGLLYPGCFVDVLGAFRLTANGLKQGQAVSTTLLQGVTVLAVEDRTLYARDTNEKQSPAISRRRSRQKHVVTLMVDAKQAKVLQLATQHGSISLAIRNPSDKGITDDQATLLRDGQLAALEELEQEFRLAGEAQPPVPIEPLTSLFEQGEELEPLAPPMWETTIIRGVSLEVRAFQLPDEEDQP